MSVDAHQVLFPARAMGGRPLGVLGRAIQLDPNLVSERLADYVLRTVRVSQSRRAAEQLAVHDTYSGMWNQT
jgi:hypothetical protein